MGLGYSINDAGGFLSNAGPVDKSSLPDNDVFFSHQHRGNIAFKDATPLQPRFARCSCCLGTLWRDNAQAAKEKERRFCWIHYDSRCGFDVLKRCEMRCRAKLRILCY